MKLQKLLEFNDLVLELHEKRIAAATKPCDVALFTRARDVYKQDIQKLLNKCFQL